MTQGNIYLDFNATTPVDSTLNKLWPIWVEMWGNPSSIHHHGRGPKKLLREARRGLALGLGVHPLELVFTSGGSEANNLALKGCLVELKKKSPQRHRVLLGSIEHPSILKQKKSLEEMGFEVVLIPVSAEGLYDLEFYKNNLDERVALVSVMLANNEVGVVAPLSEMVPLAHESGALFHSDMVQCLGKKSFDLKTLDVDLASFSSHKVYAFKGAGLLYVKKGTPLRPIIEGGSQERGRRAGTENLVAIASLAHQVENLKIEEFEKQIQPLRDEMEQKMLESISGLKILGLGVERLVNTSSFLIPGTSGESLLMNLDIKGFSVGTGAACSSGNPEPSPVLLALGLSREEAQSSLRVSLGKTTTQEHIQSFVRALKEVVDHLRKLAEETGEAYV